MDKYGRPVLDRSAGNDLKRFYQLEEEEQSEAVAEEASASSSSASEGGDTEESGTDSSADDYSSEDEPEMLVFEETMAQHPLVNQDVALGDASCRLAIVNLDWDQIKAADILQALQGFCPPTGVIRSVRVYPSQFGRERMAREAVEGPPKDIFAEAAAAEAAPAGRRKRPALVEEAEDFDEAQLRKYQLERLKYFYAVVECDATITAAALYKHCDGTEFEMSANFLDMRYIPDDVSFAEDVPADEASHAPRAYRGKTDLVTPALQHSKVKLTWDQDDPDRSRLTKANFATFDYRENDLKAYLASSSEEEDEADGDAEGRAARYRALLLGGDGNVFGRKSHDDNDDLQVTFGGGFDEASAGSDGDVHMETTFYPTDDEAEAAAPPADETLFEARLRRQRDKKKAKKEERLAKIEATKAAEKAARLDERKAAKKARRQPGEGAGQSAELELLMLEDRPDALAGRHFDMQEIVRAQSKRPKKGTAKAADAFQLDVQDTRFQAVFDQPAYAIDPTHPAYKRTDAMRSLIEERQRRNKHK